MLKPAKLAPMFCAVFRAAVWFSVVAVIPRMAEAQPGTLDPSFNAGLGLGQGLINGLVQEAAFHLDGVLLRGAFLFSRLKADGSLDTSFAPVINGFVSWFTIQPDGRILIAGSKPWGAHAQDVAKHVRFSSQRSPKGAHSHLCSEGVSRSFRAAPQETQPSHRNTTV